MQEIYTNNLFLMKMNSIHKIVNIVRWTRASLVSAGETRVIDDSKSSDLIIIMKAK
jgi:hypothetical protein